MLVLRFNEIDYPLTFSTPDAGDRHSLRMRAPNSKKILADLSWNAYTGEIIWIRVGNTKRDARELRRNGIATALLATARARGHKITHSPWRTDDGEAWARSLGEDLPKREGKSNGADIG